MISTRIRCEGEPGNSLLNSAHFPDPPSHLGPRTVFHIQRIWGEEYRDVATNVGLNNRHCSSEFLCKTPPKEINKVTESLRYSSYFHHLSVLSLQNLPTENLFKQLVNKIRGIDIIQNQNKRERERDSTKEAKDVSKKKKKILGKTNYR
jgi:hypothetical protein